MTNESSDFANFYDDRRFLAATRFWPRIPADLSPKAWLSNFTGDEQKFALALLEAFVYFSGEATDRLFTAAFQALSQDIVSEKSSWETSADEWEDFLHKVIITHPTGERPNVADSGYMFDRKCRQLLGIDERNLGTPDQAISSLMSRPDRPLVLVDDFAGTGDQVMNSWHRSHLMGGQFETSLAELAKGDVFYVLPICTERARTRIESETPIKVRAAHILPNSASVVHLENAVIPEALRPGMLQFIEKTSTRANIGTQNGMTSLGYGELGLAIAFEHSVPDATVPIFWTDTTGWKGLVKRR